MKQLSDFKEEIHKCSKCGLCQGECPIYKVTGSDCTVSRGMFIMLRGLLKGDIQMSKTLNRYLNLCLKCGACTRFCPSGIDIVDVIETAKSEYFKISRLEKIKAIIRKRIIFGFIPNFLNRFIPHTKSKTFTKKVLYFGGCGSKFKGDKSVVKLMNKMGIEVVNPTFPCCGIPSLVHGDLESFNHCIERYVKILKNYDIKEVVTTCASCEKTLKDYIKWTDSEEIKEFLETIEVKNIFEYLKDSDLTLKKPVKVTFHKPCNINNYEDIKKILENTGNLEYIEMENFDKCCGLNGLSKFKDYNIMLKIFSSKRKNIKKSGAKYVLTSCLGCEAALKLYSFGTYKVCDLTDFIADRL